jgi:CBS domain containing-hemolysin-like protein
MPVYRDDLDHFVGLLVGKDMLPYVDRGDLERTVKAVMRPIHFVPETMTVQAFVKDAQRHRAHLAVVVDEYGGTAGIVTLEDAMEQVVGDIMDEGEEEEPEYVQINESEYRVDGGFSLDELSEGDRVAHSGVVFTVEAVEGKRASSVRVQILPRTEVEETV